MAHPNIDERRASVYGSLAFIDRPLNWREIETLAQLHGCSTSAIRADLVRLAKLMAQARPAPLAAA